VTTRDVEAAAEVDIFHRSVYEDESNLRQDGGKIRRGDHVVL
jgi:hypothetical protein